MLRLLRKGLANHNQTFLKIVYTCAGVHLLLLLVACFIKHDDALHINLSVAPGARVVCVPSFMTSRSLSRIQTTRQRTRKKREVSPAKKIVQKKMAAKNKRTTPKTALTAAEQRKIKNKKNTNPKKIIEKIPEPVPEIVEQQIEPELPETHEQIITEPLDDVIYVNKETYQTLEIAQQLQEAIGKQWSPPAGMRSGLVCQVRVTINAQGKATALEVLEKSGVAVFDMAARKALLESDYPACVCGKTIVVDFNEEFL